MRVDSMDISALADSHIDHFPGLLDFVHKLDAVVAIDPFRGVDRVMRYSTVWILEIEPGGLPGRGVSVAGGGYACPMTGQVTR